MKKRSHIISYFLVILSVSFIALTGCKDDFFKQDAGDRITPDQFYESMIDADIALEGAIVYLQDVMPQLIMLDGLRSDMMVTTENASYNFVDINNQVFDKNNPILDPSNLYKVIINVNEVLANIDTISDRDRNFNAQIKHQYKGALVTLRAWTYLTIARLYNKAAIIDDNFTEVPNINQNVLDKSAVINMLIEELDDEYIHGVGITEGFQEIRFPYYMNTKALLGELYLEAGNYTEAAYYLKLACESYQTNTALLKVDETYTERGWETIFLNAESNRIENISVIPFSRAEAQFNPLGEWLSKDNLYMAKPSDVLVDSFMAQITLTGDTTDLFRGLGVTFDAVDTTVENVEYFVTKYAIDPLDLATSGSDIIISRAAGIHLMLAEAYNRLGDETSQSYALILINSGINAESPKPTEFTRWSDNIGIRGRAYLQERMVPERDSIPLEERIMIIEDNIMAEKALEMAFEGQRWFDLVRVAERRISNGDDGAKWLADIVAAKFNDDPAKYADVHAKLMNPANWYLPF